MTTLAALLAGIWFGWRLGQEAVREDLREALGVDELPLTWSEIQAEVAREGLQ